jgi:hypothetical protein
VVGEIFCRLNTYANDEIVRRLEEYGAECWMSDIGEWVWYTNSEQLRLLKLRRQTVSLTTGAALLRQSIQRHDEHALVEPVREDFRGYEEPHHISEVLECAKPYLPDWGAMGEMVLNVGKSIYLARKGVDGIVDVSPFTCMNGIVCEAIYPRVSRDNADISIRNLCFDGTQSDLDRDIGIYGESGLPVVFGLLKLYGAGGIVLVCGARPLRSLGDMRPGVAADGRFRRTRLRVANPMTRQAADGTTCCNGCDENQFVQAGLLPAPAHCPPERQVQAQVQALRPGGSPLTPAQSAGDNRNPAGSRSRHGNAKPFQWKPNAREVVLACDTRARPY